MTSPSEMNPPPHWYTSARHSDRDVPQREILLTLPEGDRKTVTRHLSHRFELQRLLDIQNFLIDQVHNRKADQERSGTRIKNALTKYYYLKFLFWGLKCIDDRCVVRCTFRSVMENIAFQELSTFSANHQNFNPCYIY